MPTNLYDGDKFGIFPDQFWFKIKFEINSIDVDAKVTAASSPKRFATEDLNETPCKVTKLENGHLSTTNNLSNGDAVVDIVKSTTPEEKENSGTSKKEELLDSIGENETRANNVEENNINVKSSENQIENVITLSA